jgi:single-strand DNA-binding protein
MNVAALVGRLTRDPELRYTPNGTATCSFTLAVDNPFATKADQKADFIPIVTWKQTAEACAQYLKKGRLCSVDGRISTRNYEKDGRKVYVTEIMAANVRFLEKTEGTQSKTDSDPFKDDGKPVDISDDDLPF